MRKYIYIGIFFLLCAGRASAQFTLVSGTVTDSSALPYACGSISASIVNQNGQSLYLNGVQFSPNPSATKLGCPTDPSTSSTSGAFTMQLADNTQIKCGSGASIVTCAIQTQWAFTVNTTGVAPPLGTGPQTCTSTLTISGGSQSIVLNTCPLLTLNSTISTNVVDVVRQTGAKFDAQLVYDVSTTLNSPTVTCPNNDCNFTGNQVGRLSWVVNNNGCNGTTQCVPVIGTVGSPPPIVLAVPSAQSITLNANANANCVAACAIIVGDDDTAQINAGYTAASQKCGTLQLPAGITIVKSAIFGDPAGTSTCSIFAAVGSRQTTTIRGYGSLSTLIVPSINFDMTSCTMSLFGGQPGGTCFGIGSLNAHGAGIQGFSIYGMGLNMGASANNKVGIALGNVGHNYNIYDVQLLHWNAGATGSVGMFFAGGTTMLEGVQVDGFNNTPCMLNGGNALLHGNYFCGDSPGPALSINTAGVAGQIYGTYGGQYCSTGNPTVQIGAGTLWNSVNEQFQTGICFGAPTNQKIFNGGTGGTFSFTGAQINGPQTNDIGFDVPGTINLLDSQITVNASGGACFRESGTTNFFDLGGNSITCSILLNNTGFLTGLSVNGDGHSVKGACTGTATAASTLGFYGTGPNVTLTTCTSATIGTGIVVSGARKVWALNVSAGTAGVNASSGVVTVLQNGNLTTMTCTIGTGTTCTDGTHTFTTVDGDRISLQFTTQAADTLANVKAVVVWN